MTQTSVQEIIAKGISDAVLYEYFSDVAGKMQPIVFHSILETGLEPHDCLPLLGREYDNDSYSSDPHDMQEDVLRKASNNIIKVLADAGYTISKLEVG